MPLALIGIIVIAVLIGFGIWKLFTSVTLKSTTDRYRYERVKDEDGNEILKVVDLEDDGK